MTTADQTAVLGRIAAAIRRIETASQSTNAGGPSRASDGPSEALSALQVRHDRLRNETNAALEALDAVIGRAQNRGQS